MKTAVLLTGHYRTFDQCKQYLIPELNKKFNPDYFINTYKERYNYHPCVSNSIGCFNEEQIDADWFSDIPYKCSLFDTLDFANTVYNREYARFSPFMYSNSKSHFLHIWKLLAGLNLINKYEQDVCIDYIKYDCVVICRMDVVPKKIDLLDFCDYENSVYLTKSHMPEACDHILISTKDNLNSMLCWMYDEFFNYTNQTSNKVMPHTLFDNGIKHIGLNRVDYPILDYVLRYGGNKDIEA